MVFPFYVAPGLSAAAEPAVTPGALGTPRYRRWVERLLLQTKAGGARTPRHRHQLAGSAGEFALPRRRRVRLPGCPDGLRPSFSILSSSKWE